MEKNTKVGILGPKHLIGNNSVEPTARMFPRLYVQILRRSRLRNTRFIKEKVDYDEMAGLDKNKISEVDWLQSSCIAIRKKLWDQLNGFSEKYFLFLSDTDLCWRAWEKNYKVVYYPNAIVHSDGLRASAGSWKNILNSKTIRIHLIDSLKFRLSHFFKKNPRQRDKI